MRDKNIWVFNAGNSFDGNPKWLFLYIYNYRKDITPYWFCYSQDTVNYIRKLGYSAYLFESKQGRQIGEQAGVYVVNQNKELFQDYLNGITVLNLWHGVGCKAIEKNVTQGFLNERIVKKRIRNMEIYQKNQLFLVTSPMMEKHFMEQCDIDADKIIRAGYPCCTYPGSISTYNHNILKIKNLPVDTKIAIYAPTYRDANATDFFQKAIPDMEKLIKILGETKFMLIFKLHPLMSNDFQYQNIKQIYKDNPRVMFWDNANDIYEIFDQIDLAIIDYSSIFYDMLAKGIKHFIRYIFDYDAPEAMRDFAFDYKEMSCGKICTSFEDLLKCFVNIPGEDSGEIERIYNLFWSYSDEHSIEKIIDRALEFIPDEEKELPTLYSFDVFDTLIGRTTLKPDGVFRYVQDKICESTMDFPSYLKKNFYKIRTWGESNVREYYKKTRVLRKSNQTEISFDLIYERIQNLYTLTDNQTEQLKEWELECELKTSCVYTDNVSILKNLLEKGETVILISDMYLPEAFVKKFLQKADPVLTTIPLFLSSTYGTQKTTKELFFDVYHKLDYHFGKWVHYGDNPKADGSIPRQLGIETINHTIPKLNSYENKLNLFINSYDAYQVSALFARFRDEEHTVEEIYAYSYVSLYWVPYIDWVIRHAIENKMDCLYFISRDGYHLKRIADVLIEEKHLNIKTKYIYGSRKAWRIPSQIHQIDNEFFSEFGNFVDITDYNHLLTAAGISENDFVQMFPELAYLKNESQIAPDLLIKIRESFHASEMYRSYLLKEAERRREIVLQYLEQEIDFHEKYAFVEFWGRGYTQTCLANLLTEVHSNTSENIFYYARSIYPSEGNIVRYNFTGNNYSMIFIEAIFANLPYKSIESYEKVNGKIVPVIQECENNGLLHAAMEKYLVRFAHDFSHLNLENEDEISRSLFDFSLSFFHRNHSSAIFTQTLATLSDSVAIHGSVSEYAPPITAKDIFHWIKGGRFVTSDFKLSLARSSPILKRMYGFYHKNIHGTKCAAVIQKLRLSRKR